MGREKGLLTSQEEILTFSDDGDNPHLVVKLSGDGTCKAVSMTEHGC